MIFKNFYKKLGLIAALPLCLIFGCAGAAAGGGTSTSSIVLTSDSFDGANATFNSTMGRNPDFLISS